MTLVNAGFKPMQRTFNNIFDEFFTEFPAILDKTGLNFPPVNINETPDAYHLEFNVPGRNKEDFKVNVENGLLTIGYEKKEEAKVEGVKSVRKEFSFQSFKRSFNIDENVDASGIQAKYENGLLKLWLPKKPAVKEAAKNITIQ